MRSSSAVEQLTVNQFVVGSIPTFAAISNCFQNGKFHLWACSSVGQSKRLIIVWSWVQVPPGPQIYAVVA